MELITQQMVLVILFLSSPKCRVQSKTAPLFQWGGEAGCALEGGWRRPSDSHPKELSRALLGSEVLAAAGGYGVLSGRVPRLQRLSSSF